VVVLLCAVGIGLLIWRPWNGRHEEQGTITPVSTLVVHDASTRGPTHDASHANTPPSARDASTQTSPVDGGSTAPATSPPTTQHDGGSPQKTARDADGLSNDAENQSPAQRRRELVGKARRRIRHGLYNQATDYLNEAASIRNGSDIQVLLSQVYEKRGRTRSAIYFMKLALSYSPNNARYHDRLGSLLIKHGERTRACRSFRHSLKINSKLNSARRHVDRYCRR
jgi:hypothetical protein